MELEPHTSTHNFKWGVDIRRIRSDGFTENCGATCSAPMAAAFFNPGATMSANGPGPFAVRRLCRMPSPRSCWARPRKSASATSSRRRRSGRRSTAAGSATVQSGASGVAGPGPPVRDLQPARAAQSPAAPRSSTLTATCSTMRVSATSRCARTITTSTTSRRGSAFR